VALDWIDGLVVGAGVMYVFGAWRRHRLNKQRPILIYGDQFADDSPRSRQRTAQALVAKALGPK